MAAVFIFNCVRPLNVAFWFILLVIVFYALTITQLTFIKTLMLPLLLYTQYLKTPLQPPLFKTQTFLIYIFVVVCVGGYPLHILLLLLFWGFTFLLLTLY